MLQRMCSTFKPFETSSIEYWNNGLSSDRKKSLGNYFCVTLQALKMSLKFTPLTFRVKTLQDDICFDRRIDESALNKVQKVKEYHFNPYLLFSEKWEVWECFELCNYVNGNCRIFNMANICQHNNHRTSNGLPKALHFYWPTVFRFSASDMMSLINILVSKKLVAKYAFHEENCVFLWWKHTEYEGSLSLLLRERESRDAWSY